MSRFEKATGLLAGFALLSICLAILWQIFGRAVGFRVNGAVEFATYAMIASVFLGLPYTFATGGHIRVTLAISRLRRRARYVTELACHLLSLAFMLYFARYSLDLTRMSWVRGSKAGGLLPVPLWIPQSFITLGVILLSITIAWATFCLLRQPRSLDTIIKEDANVAE